MRRNDRTHEKEMKKDEMENERNARSPTEKRLEPACACADAIRRVA